MTLFGRLSRWLRPLRAGKDETEARLVIDRLAPQKPPPTAELFGPAPPCQESVAVGDTESPKHNGLLAGAGTANIPLLLALVTPQAGRRPAAADDAEQALDRVIQTLAPDDLPRLDRRLRGSAVPERAWQALTPRQLDVAAGDGTVPFSFCCLAASHPAGRVREAAVRIVAADARALPFLLIRANDWVDEVRRAARAALESLEGTAPIESWTRSLPLLLRLERCGRGDHRDLVARAVDRLSAPEAEAVLARSLISPRREVRRAAFEVGAVRRRPSLELLDAALYAGDPVIRLRAARQALERLGEHELRALATRLDRDPFAAARMLALDIHRRLPPAEARQYLLGHLTDPGASIRGASQYYLRRDFATDCAVEYRRMIAAGATPRRLAASLLGLGETGDAADVATALGHSSHPVTRVRAAVLRAATRLDATAGGACFVEALADPSPRVARIARDALLRSLTAAHVPAIRAVFQTAPHLHSRRCALEALARSGPYSYLADLLGAIADPEPEIVERARLALDRWLCHAARHALRPSAAQLEAARAALDACAERLDAKIVRELRAALTR